MRPRIPPSLPALPASVLRREISARNLQQAELPCHELTFGDTTTVLYGMDGEGHGNFLPPSYRRVLADPAWRRRLAKAYTASERVPRAGDRRRFELDCAHSSDALLMNVFCYPGVTRRAAFCRLLGLPPGERPEFGVRANLPMRNGETDRTELDMTLRDLLVEAKLTEGGFGEASPDRLGRYLGLAEIFDLDLLPRTRGRFAAYQVVRGVLAAHHAGGTFLLLHDARRPDLRESFFEVLRAVRFSSLRSRLAVLSWQELAGALPPQLRLFLSTRFGIDAA